MNRTLLPTLIGVFSSLLAIWALHSFLVVDDCLDHGGSFQYDTGKCVLENGEVYTAYSTSMLLVLFFVVGFIVSLLVASIVRKAFNIKR